MTARMRTQPNYRRRTKCSTTIITRWCPKSSRYGRFASIHCTFQLALQFVFFVFFRLHWFICMFCFTLDSWVISIHGLVCIIWQPKAGLAYNVSYAMLYSSTEQKQQRETNSKPGENELKKYGMREFWNLAVLDFKVSKFLGCCSLSVTAGSRLSATSCCGAGVTNLKEPPSSFLLPPRYCGLGAGSIPFRAIVNKKQCKTRGLFMSLVIHYWIGDVQDS